jgi:hypothetical protein
MNEAKLASLLDNFIQICLDLFGPERIEAIIQHGSSFKGGAIPGYSDIDLHVYLTPEGFGPGGRLTDETIFAFQERFSSLPWDETGYAYPQVYFLDWRRMPEGWIGPPPGTYRDLFGRLPEDALPTEEEVRRSSLAHLAAMPRYLAAEIDGFLDDTARSLPRRLRLLGTTLTPTIFALLAYDAANPFAVWAQSKFEALRQLEERYPDAEGPAHARRFYEQVASIYGAPEFDVVAAREAFRTGVRFLRWAESITLAIKEPL